MFFFRLHPPPAPYVSISSSSVSSSLSSSSSSSSSLSSTSCLAFPSPPVAMATTACLLPVLPGRTPGPMAGVVSIPTVCPTVGLTTSQHKACPTVTQNGVNLSTGATTAAATAAAVVALGAGRRRKARTVFSDSQLNGLEKRFESQRYLSTPERIELATRLGLSETQVSSSHAFGDSK
ncbi:unnamed protein product [Protopolystoma xenopodis]|uniref:Homeobox domain-containing protein n=1 Tax=Protopolystoma xenopodis TaxID=117903 RepID=A0A3S5CKD4_9PLAT|nr:unnamed protein product [Protopolystoma xenopodis]